MVRSGKVLVLYWYRMVLYRIVPVARSRLPGWILIGPSQIPAYGIMYTLSILLYFVLYMLFHHGADGVTKHQLSPTKSTPATRSNWTRLFFLFCVRFVSHPAGSTQMGPFLTAGNRGCCQRPMIACLTVELSVELSSLSFLVS